MQSCAVSSLLHNCSTHLTFLGSWFTSKDQNHFLEEGNILNFPREIGSILRISTKACYWEQYTHFLSDIMKWFFSLKSNQEQEGLPTNFPLSYNSLPCLSLTRSGRAWMEEWSCPSHCLICLGKALTSNTNLNDSSENLGSVSQARLGLAQWPSPGEHGKFAGSICHRQRELRREQESSD